MRASDFHRWTPYEAPRWQAICKIPTSSKLSPINTDFFYAKIQALVSQMLKWQG
jgi:ribosomal protein S19E (S16A)